MKSLFIATSFLALSSLAQAKDIKVGRSGTLLNVTRVWTKSSEARGPMVNVYASIVADNACVLPTAREIVKFQASSEGQNETELQVISVSTRSCTMEYKPIEAVLDLGVYTHPLDHAFQVIRVNGVSAE
jgi:hypothetical protein